VPRFGPLAGNDLLVEPLAVGEDTEFPVAFLVRGDEELQRGLLAGGDGQFAFEGGGFLAIEGMCKQDVLLPGELDQLRGRALEVRGDDAPLGVPQRDRLVVNRGGFLPSRLRRLGSVAGVVLPTDRAGSGGRR